MRIGKSECCGKGKFKIPQAANGRDKLKLPADMLINNLTRRSDSVTDKV